MNWHDWHLLVLTCLVLAIVGFLGATTKNRTWSAFVALFLAGVTIVLGCAAALLSVLP